MRLKLFNLIIIILCLQVHTSKPLHEVWLFQPSVISRSRPPPHYREIMPNYRKVIFLLPPWVNITTITWVPGYCAGELAGVMN